MRSFFVFLSLVFLSVSPGTLWGMLSTGPSRGHPEEVPAHRILAFAPGVSSFWDHPQAEPFLAQGLGTSRTRDVTSDFGDCLLTYAQRQGDWLARSLEQVRETAEGFKKALEIHGFDQTAGAMLDRSLVPFIRLVQPDEEIMAWMRLGETAFQELLRSGGGQILESSKEFARLWLDIGQLVQDPAIQEELKLSVVRSVLEGPKGFLNRLRSARQLRTDRVGRDGEGSSHPVCVEDTEDAAGGAGSSGQVALTFPEGSEEDLRVYTFCSDETHNQFFSHLVSSAYREAFNWLFEGGPVPSLVRGWVKKSRTEIRQHLKGRFDELYEEPKVRLMMALKNLETVLTTGTFRGITREERELFEAAHRKIEEIVNGEYAFLIGKSDEALQSITAPHCGTNANLILLAGTWTFVQKKAQDLEDRGIGLRSDFERQFAQTFFRRAIEAERANHGMVECLKGAIYDMERRLSLALLTQISPGAAWYGEALQASNLFLTLQGRQAWCRLVHMQALDLSLLSPDLYRGLGEITTPISEIPGLRESLRVFQADPGCSLEGEEEDDKVEFSLQEEPGEGSSSEEIELDQRRMEAIFPASSGGLEGLSFVLSRKAIKDLRTLPDISRVAERMVAMSRGENIYKLERLLGHLPGSSEPVFTCRLDERSGNRVAFLRRERVLVFLSFKDHFNPEGWCSDINYLSRRPVYTCRDEEGAVQALLENIKR